MRDVPGLTLEPFGESLVKAQFDLNLSLTETPLGLHASFIYNLDLFEAQTITRMMAHFHRLLGILKAGGAYVPLDPAFPPDRLEYMLSDSGLAVLLTQERLVNALPEHNARIIRLDADWGEIAAEADTNLGLALDPERLAYVIYTSGSTGRPKGVQVVQRALVNFLEAMRREPGITPEDRLLSVTTLSFDIAGLELYLPLIAGARLEIVPRELAADGFRLRERLRESGATILQATPATWLLLEAGWDETEKRKVLCGGEAPGGLPRSLPRAVGRSLAFAPAHAAAGVHDPWGVCLTCLNFYAQLE